MLTKELILGILHRQKFTAKVYGSPADIISAEDFSTVAEEILLIAQPNIEPSPQLQQTPVSGRSEQLPPVVADEEISAQSIVQCSKELGLGAVTQVYFRKGAKWMRERLGGNCH